MKNIQVNKIENVLDENDIYTILLAHRPELVVIALKQK